LPAILPYCPSPRTGELVKLTKDEYMQSIYSAAMGMLDFTDKRAHSFPSLHSMCIVGTTTDPSDGGAYFVCAQTWDGSEVVLVPLVANEEFAMRYGYDRVLSYILALNLIFIHQNGPHPRFPMPLDQPITYRQASCLPPILQEPRVSAQAPM
jgi:hypothetical protein